MTERELLDMLRSGRAQESSLVERKPDGFKDREARKTVVAFANSTPDGKEAVLFIGVHDKTGVVMGVANPDELQKKYARVLSECYPEITYRMHVIPFEGRDVVAIVVPASASKPHFAGAAYVREGSRSMPATIKLYEELILSRSDKTRQLLKFKYDHAMVTVRGLNYHLGTQRVFTGGGHTEEIPDCKVEDCNGFHVRLFRLDSRVYFSEDLSRVTLSFDDEKNRPMLLVVAPGRS